MDVFSLESGKLMKGKKTGTRLRTSIPLLGEKSPRKTGGGKKEKSGKPGRSRNLGEITLR